METYANPYGLPYAEIAAVRRDPNGVLRLEVTCPYCHGTHVHYDAREGLRPLKQRVADCFPPGIGQYLIQADQTLIDIWG